MTKTNRWGSWISGALGVLAASALLLGVPTTGTAQDDSDFENDNLALMERSTAVDLGRVWRQSENGWSGVWTRRGNSNTFDAVWTKDSVRVTSVLTMKLLSGSRVSILRRDTSHSTVVDYTANIGSNGRVTGTGKVRNGIGPYQWTARIEGASTTAAPKPTPPRAPVATPPAGPPDATPPGTQPDKPGHSAGLGRVWHEEENGWSGTWKRRGNSNTFDAVWTKGSGRVTAVLTMTQRSGGRVSIHREDTSSTMQVGYEGTIRGDQVRGTGKILSTGWSFPWHARIDD